ncbi:MAG: hypothetical protein EXR72_24825 [Myxococcales bacterium]|nr:hypothetical protein [Myxococcales bacterium]
MGQLSEGKLDEIIAAGCASCGGRRLLFRALLDGRLPLLAGEPVGALTWVYDGEKFVDGVFEITCAACKNSLFRADDCPRCNAANGLARALEERNRWPVPTACPSCGGEEVRYVGFVPAQVAYEGTRSEKPRSTIELLDPGFHGFRVDCIDCGTVAEQRDRCPLCDAPGPLRERPG